MCRRKNSKDLRGGKRSRLGGQSLVAELGSGRIWEMQIQNKNLVQTTLATQMQLPNPIVAFEQPWMDSAQSLLSLVEGAGELVIQRSKPVL